jgi:hypothetical protein
MSEEGAEMKYAVNRTTLVYGALLIVSFAATYGIVTMQRGDGVLWSKAEVSAAANTSASTATNAPVAAHAPGMADMTAVVENPPADAPVEQVDTQRQQIDAAVTEVGQQALSGTPAQRSAAVSQLAAMSSRLADGADPVLLNALENTATSAQEWQLRMRAVIALASAAPRMPDRSRAIAILERASADPHRAVAQRAQAALRSLNSSGDPRT